MNKDFPKTILFLYCYMKLFPLHDETGKISGFISFGGIYVTKAIPGYSHPEPSQGTHLR